MPVKMRVSLLDLEHVLDTYICNENATPAEGSQYRTPLTRLGALLDANQIDMEPLDSARRFAHWFCDPQDRRIHSNLPDGRAPYINYEYCRYTSPAMRKLPNLAGILRIRGDLRNLQTVHAWQEDGAYFGVLYAEGQFGKVPNNIRIRKLFGHYKKLAAFSERADDTPMQALFQHLKKGAPQNPTMALQLAYVTHYLSQHVSREMLAEWGQSRPIVGKPDAANEDESTPAQVPHAVSGSDVMAMHRQAIESDAASAPATKNAASANQAHIEPQLALTRPTNCFDDIARVRVLVPRRLRN